MVWYGMVCHGMVWYGMVWHGMVWYGMVWYGMVWHGMVWYGMIWYGTVWYGMVWYGTVRYGMVRNGMIRIDKVCYGARRDGTGGPAFLLSAGGAPRVDERFSSAGSVLARPQAHALRMCIVFLFGGARSLRARVTREAFRRLLRPSWW